MTFQRLGAMTSRFVFGAALAAAVAGSALIMPTVARAHEVWLEADGAGTTLYFGEFGDNLHEASPGYLDKLTQLTASVVSAKGEKLLRAKRLPDGIAFAGRAVSGESVVAVDMPSKVLSDIHSTWQVKSVRTHPKGKSITLLVYADQVPGGVVSHSSKELDASGQVVRRSTLEVVDYGVEPDRHLLRFLPFKQRGKETRRR